MVIMAGLITTATMATVTPIAAIRRMVIITTAKSPATSFRKAETLSLGLFALFSPGWVMANSALVVITQSLHLPGWFIIIYGQIHS